MVVIGNIIKSVSFFNAIIFVACACALIFLFQDTFWYLHIAWNSEEYSHGYLIPFIALLLGFNILSKHSMKARPSWLAAFFIPFVIIFSIIGEHAASRHIIFLGLWLSIIMVIASQLGWRAIFVLAAPLIYLLFAIPAPYELYSRASVELQLLSSILGAGLLDLSGISVYREGNIIDLGFHKLQVVEACNGLRYIFPLLSFAALIAYLLQDSLWKRVFIFVSAIPLAILMNVIRIASAGIAVNMGGAGMAEGIIHDLQGWAVFSICIAILALEAYGLKRIGTGGFFDWSLLSWPDSLKPWRAFDGMNKPAIGFLALTLLFVPFLKSNGLTKDVNAVAVRANLSTFPLVLDGWKGRTVLLDRKTLDVLKIHDYANINYNNALSHASVNLFITYLDNQRMGVIIHPPTSCLPGSGWKIVSEQTMVVSPKGEYLQTVSPKQVVRLSVANGEKKMLIYYWYEQQGEETTSQLDGRLRMTMNSLLHGRTDGALVRVSTPVLDDETEQAAENRALSFLQDALIEIEARLPNAVIKD